MLLSSASVSASRWMCEYLSAVILIQPITECVGQFLDS